MERRRWMALGLSTLVGIGLLASTTTTASADSRQPTRTTTTTPTRSTELGAPLEPGVDPPYDPHELEDLVAPWSPPQGPGSLTNPEQPSRPDGPGDKKAPDTRKVKEGCVGGRLLDRHDGAEYLPSYGWRVYLWFYDDVIGGKVSRNVWVGTNPQGEWQYCPPDLVGQGKQFAYVYVAKNKWIQLNDDRSYDYSGVWYWNPINVKMGMPPTHGIYPNAPYLQSYPQGQLLPTDHLYLGSWNDHDDDNDGKADDVDGEGEDGWANEEYAVGNLMRWSMETFAKLDHEGVNPAPNGPHLLYYPNNWCNTACYTSGSIRIPNTYALLNKYTVQHEVGHAIVDQWWAGSGIPMVGGKHELGTCGAKTDLVFQEALATYISMWTHNTDGGVYTGYNAGDPFNPEDSGDPCNIVSDGAQSEEYVVEAMWDLQDHQVDGKDTLGMNEPAAIIRWLLLNPMKDAHVMRSKLLTALPDYSTWIKGVFSQAFITS